VYENPWMSVTEDDVQRRDGSIGQYGVVHSRDFVLVIPFDGERYHLVEQYRYPVGARLWEFPQGSVAGGESLPPEALAAIVLVEETGIRAGRLERLGFLHHGYGRSTNGFHAFYATELVLGPAEREVEEQDMRSGAFSRDELWDLVATGVMTDAASLAALALLDRRRRAEGAPPPD
jgi:8-oxo-dGTP pyrophosphatase MutT (NUDIX family)